MNRESIVSAAWSYIDVPYLHQGRSRLGVDCAGLLMCVAYDMGIKDVRISDYGRSPDANRARTIIEEHMERIRFSELEIADVLSFVILNDVQHYGIVTQMDPIRFVHSYQTVGKVIEQALVDPWLRRVRGCYRFPE